MSFEDNEVNFEVPFDIFHELLGCFNDHQMQPQIDLIVSEPQYVLFLFV